jgi:branched-chain amino acid transport system substrate-binding protein
MDGELIGRQIGKYQVQARLGRGGMGTVYLGYDPLLDRRVAIKVLAPHLVWEPGFVERFLQEARAAARLKHRHIVIIYDVGQDQTDRGNWYYFVMEYVEGQTLAQVIKEQGALSPASTLAILRPLADALDYAHSQGVVHRDIKPGNILIGSSGQVTLTDFGIARAAQETRLTATGTLMGTPEYMSPEQARGEEVDQRTDQYSLGVVAYEMLSGHVPFGGTTPHGVLYKQIHEPPPPIRQARPELPPGLEATLQKALAKEPDERYRTVTAFAEALGQASAGKTVAHLPTVQIVPGAKSAAPQMATRSHQMARPPVRPPATAAVSKTRRRKSKRPWALAGFAVIIVLALAAVTVLFLTDGMQGSRMGNLSTATENTSPTQIALPSTAAGPGLAGPFECRDKIGCIVVGPDQPIRIGAILAMDGPDAALGVDSWRGVEIAAADKPEVMGHRLELVSETTRCDGESGVMAANKLAGDPQLVAVVGPSCSAEARSAVPILCQAGLSVVSPSSTAPDLTDERRPAELWCYLRTAPNDQAQAQAAARFAREGLRLDRAATLQDDSQYALQLQEVFAQTFRELGGTITVQLGVGPQGDGTGPALAQIAESESQFLYYPVLLDAGAAVTRQTREMPGLEKLERMVADSLFSPELLAAARDAAVGIYWSSPNPSTRGPGYEAFVGKYRDRYGEAPVSVYHAHAYDATMLILSAIERTTVHDPDGTLHIPRQALNEALHTTKNLPGLAGPLNCNPSGDCAEPNGAIYVCVNPDPGRWNPGAGQENNPRQVWP